MSQAPKTRHPGPPHNPDVRDLVEGKRRWSSRLKPDVARQGFRGWNERGYLPHRDEPGLTQFVTFRLADSFPEALRSEWEPLLKIEDDQRRRVELESYLDAGHGECHLRRPEVAMIVEDAVRFFHGKRYDLRAWVVMPNHLHGLFKVDATPMAEILESWKKHAAQKANRLLGRRGGFWQADYWDTFMRDSEHETKTRNYIENNPVKAGLVADPKAWRWSSARFRDEFGMLRFWSAAAGLRHSRAPATLWPWVWWLSANGLLFRVKSLLRVLYKFGVGGVYIVVKNEAGEIWGGPVV